MRWYGLLADNSKKKIIQWNLCTNFCLCCMIADKDRWNVFIRHSMTQIEQALCKCTCQTISESKIYKKKFHIAFTVDLVALIKLKLKSIITILQSIKIMLEIIIHFEFRKLMHSNIQYWINKKKHNKHKKHVMQFKSCWKITGCLLIYSSL